MAKLGYSVGTTSTDDCYAQYIRGGVYVAEATGTLDLPRVQFSVDSGGTCTWYVVVYSMSGANPNAVLGKTTAQTTAAGSSLAWRTASAWDGSAPTVTAGTSYSLQFFTPSDAKGNIARTTSGGTGVYANVGGTSIPDPYTGTHTHTDSVYRIYCPTLVGAVPTAPTKGTPADSSSLNPAVANTFTYTFNGTGPQTKNQYRYRDQTVGSWTTATAVATSVPSFVIPAATFADATDYYVQVRTSNVTGDSPWSASWSVSGVAVPDVPVIDSPANDSTATTSSVSLAWTQTNQDAYRARIYSDDSGSPDTLLYDTDVVEESATRAVTLDVTSYNGTTVHLQIAARYSASWSSYADIRVVVGFTGPQTPTVTLVADPTNRYISVTASHPNPATQTSQAADGFLLKFSEVNWAGCTGATPTAETGTTASAQRTRATDYILQRGYVAFDVSSYSAMTVSSAVLRLYMTDFGGTTSFKVYYQDWGTSLAAGDWVSLAGLTAASASQTVSGTGWKSITLTNVGSLLTANGRFVIALDDETTEPGEENAVEFYTSEGQNPPELILTFSEPLPIAEDIYRGTTSTFADAIRIVRDWATDEPYYDRECASGTDFWYWCVAKAADGTSTKSAATN